MLLFLNNSVIYFRFGTNVLQLDMLFFDYMYLFLCDRLLCTCALIRDLNETSWLIIAINNGKILKVTETIVILWVCMTFFNRSKVKSYIGLI